jgi:gamma-glutamyltranspeptidase / glutathione hydrolase
MFDYKLPYPSGRSPVFGRSIVSTSQPLAVGAGMRALAEGGNALDAALAAAITLTVVEPTSNGVGSDAFAVVWDGSALHGLNASGRSPKAWTPERFAEYSTMPARGWESVTVPGAVSAWVALSERFGKLPFARLFEPAVHYAREGYHVTPVIASGWARNAHLYRGQPGYDEAFLPGGRAPKPGERFALPALADTLEVIAESRGTAFYEGSLAEAMVRHGALHGAAMTMEDLATHRADWCGTIAADFSDLEVHEIPPNGQGLATLVAIAILEQLGIGEYAVDSLDSLHLQIEAMKLALADADAYVADADAMKIPPAALLERNYIARRAKLVDRCCAQDFGAGAPKSGGTVYLSTADASGMMVSYIQSNYEGFGSGVVVPGTGISLQNRGLGFSLKPGHPNVVGPRKRPFHTIIPGFAMRNGTPIMSFGVMGGPMQAQGHLQLVLRTQLYRQNPQAASDAPRWRIVRGKLVALETGFDEKLVLGLADLGHDIQRDPPEANFAFGGAQLICRMDNGYVAGSDHRKDGFAASM